MIIKVCGDLPEFVTSELSGSCNTVGLEYWLVLFQNPGWNKFWCTLSLKDLCCEDIPWSTAFSEEQYTEWCWNMKSHPGYLHRTMHWALGIFFLLSIHLYWNLSAGFRKLKADLNYPSLLCYQILPCSFLAAHAKKAVSVPDVIWIKGGFKDCLVTITM